MDEMRWSPGFGSLSSARKWILSIIIACLSTSWGAAHARVPNSYKVSWDEATFPVANVDAELEVSNGKLTMFTGLNDAFEQSRGFAAHVYDLEVTTSEGKPLRAIADQESGWSLPDFQSGRVRLRYRVNLRYASHAFPTGNEQIALLEGQGLFLTGFALFITSETDSASTVAIHVPSGWDVTTSWTKQSNGRFHADNKNKLLRNILAVGRGYYSDRLVRNGVELRIVLFGLHAASAQTVRDVFLPVMDYYAKVFQDQEPGHFTLAILPGPNDGEGYIDSFASSQSTALLKENEVVWANSLAHEFFHYWNGSRIASTWEHYPERQWFSEGFTEYYANRALLAIGVLDRATYDEILSQYLSFHLLFATSGIYGDVTMRDAGRKKGLYRPGVYDSGVAMAFCLDGMIRRSSHGARNLDNLMRLLDSRYGATHRPIEFADIVNATNEVLGEDRTDFFAAHVEARNPLPVEACAKDMGYKLSVDGYHVLLRPQ